jgi:hypothetical protein
VLNSCSSSIFRRRSRAYDYDLETCVDISGVATVIPSVAHALELPGKLRGALDPTKTCLFGRTVGTSTSVHGDVNIGILADDRVMPRSTHFTLDAEWQHQRNSPEVQVASAEIA